MFAAGRDRREVEAAQSQTAAASTEAHQVKQQTDFCICKKWRLFINEKKLNYYISENLPHFISVRKSLLLACYIIFFIGEHTGALRRVSGKSVSSHKLILFFKSIIYINKLNHW